MSRNLVARVGLGRPRPILPGVTSPVPGASRRSDEQQAALAALARRALDKNDVDGLMHEAADAVAAGLGVSHASVLERQPEGEQLRLRAVAGSGGATGAGKVPTGLDSQARYTLRVGRPVVIEDGRTERRARGAASLIEDSIVSGVMAPIEGQGEACGVIGAYTAERRHFMQHDVGFVQAVADVLGAAVDARRANQVEHRLHQSECFESMEQLAHGMAHAFNNLLGVIVNYTSFAVEELGDERPEILADLNEARRAAERGGQLTSRLALLGRGTPDLAPTDANTVVAQAAGVLRRGLGGDIGLEADLAPGPLRTRLAAGELEEILIDIVANAREANPREGALRIETRAVALDWEDVNADLPPGRYLRLTVTDSGAGMPRENAERAFEPFFTTKVGAAGLGLTIVRGIVGRAGGRVTLDSEPGRGTSVSVELPLVSQATPRTGRSPDEPREFAGAGGEE